MIKRIKNYLHRFTFQKPLFSRLNFSRIIIHDHAYLLITWQAENTNKVKIRQLKFKSRNSSGSAYTSIPNDTESIELNIANYWHKTRYVIPIQEIVLDKELDFSPPASITGAKPVFTRQFRVSFRLNSIQTSIRPLKTKIPRLTITNLTKQ